VSTVSLVIVPAEHDLLPDAVYPLLHVGVHELPIARLDVQSPSAPLDGAGVASQVGAGVGVDVVGVAVGEAVGVDVVGVAVGEAVGVDVVGVAVGEAVGVDVVGVAVGEATQLEVSTSRNTPVIEQLREPVNEYPGLQVGWHVLPID
jgi:hypothetical protein